jgi:hypothetical protein
VTDLEVRRPPRGGGEFEGDKDRVTERVKLRPRLRSPSLAILGGVRDTDRRRSGARSREGDRDPEYEDPVYED